MAGFPQSRHKSLAYISVNILQYIEKNPCKLSMTNCWTHENWFAKKV